MAQSLRATGTVLLRSVRTGNRKSDGQAYKITDYRVLVADAGVADVSVPDDMDKYTRGEVVDLLVDVDVYGGRASLRAVADLTAA